MTNSEEEGGKRLKRSFLRLPIQKVSFLCFREKSCSRHSSRLNPFVSLEAISINIKYLFT